MAELLTDGGNVITVGNGGARTPLSDLALKVLGAGAAGIGILGLVAGVGGAVMFERFTQAGLPAEQAVAVQPKAVLLAVGAEILIPMAGTILVVVTAYVLTWWLVRKGWTRWAPGNLKLRPMSDVGAWVWGLPAAFGAVLYYIAAVGGNPPLSSVLSVCGVSVAALLLWLMIADLQASFGARVVVLALLTIAVAGWIGLIRTMDYPKLRGAAVLFSSPSGVASASRHVSEGLFVAETSDRVYLAQKYLAAGSLIVLNRRDIVTVALGSNQRLRTAIQQSIELGDALRRGATGSPY